MCADTGIRDVGDTARDRDVKTRQSAIATRRCIGTKAMTEEKDLSLIQALIDGELDAEARTEPGDNRADQ